MRVYMGRWLTGLMIAGLSASEVWAETNSWTLSYGDYWRVTTNWSLGVRPASTHEAVLVTNANTKTVLIDATTANSFPASMTISNLLIAGPASTVNTVSVATAGSATALHILNDLTITNGGALAINNSTLIVDGDSGGGFYADGPVTMTNGSVLADAVVTSIGNVGTGSLKVSDGQLVTSEIDVGVEAGSCGTLTVAGGTVGDALIAGYENDATGMVWVTGGQLVVTNGVIIGAGGVGQLTVSNGSVLAQDVDLGVFSNAVGTLTVAGGTVSLVSPPDYEGSWFGLGSESGSVGVAWITGGSLVATDDCTFVGNDGVGQMTVSNGTVRLRDVYVGSPAGGTLTVAGGTNMLTSLLSVGEGPDQVGAVWVTGGRLVATNDETDVGYEGTGQLTISNGAWLAREVVVAPNSTARGTLTVAGGTVNLLADLTVGFETGAVGIVRITGGQVAVSNGLTQIAGRGVGEMIVEGATVWARDVTVALLGGGQGRLTVASGALRTAGAFTVGDQANATGAVWVTGGNLVVTNNNSVIGNSGVGQMIVSNGTMLGKWGYMGTSSGSLGALAIAGGTNTWSSFLRVGYNAAGTGAVCVTGGYLSAASLSLGFSGIGQLLVSNGICKADYLYLGVNPGAQGGLTLAGGTSVVSWVLSMGYSTNASGTAWITGGELLATNQFIYVGEKGRGQMTISNGSARAQAVFLGVNPGAQGTLTVAGGTALVSSLLAVGSSDCSATGTLLVSGGSVIVTNATADAVLDVRSGKFILNGGVLLVDRFVMTNACAQFVRTGGTLIYGTAILTATRDDDSDGMLNGWEQSYGLDPLNAADANADSDGDGLSNLQESQAGTDPTNSASVFRIAAITREGNNVRVTWMTGTGKTNALQATGGDVGGGYTNTFADLFIVTNTVSAVTNYLDVGGATNSPARYYRVRLVP
jgi:T5SS/PEP-CTERM-associated repeat protein